MSFTNLFPDKRMWACNRVSFFWVLFMIAENQSKNTYNEVSENVGVKIRLTSVKLIFGADFLSWQFGRYVGSWHEGFCSSGFLPPAISPRCGQLLGRQTIHNLHHLLINASIKLIDHFLHRCLMPISCLFWHVECNIRPCTRLSPMVSVKNCTDVEKPVFEGLKP